MIYRVECFNSKRELEESDWCACATVDSLVEASRLASKEQRNGYWVEIFNDTTNELIAEFKQERGF